MSLDFIQHTIDEFRAGNGLGIQLRINRLTLCDGLHHHHRMEDGGLLPVLDTL